MFSLDIGAHFAGVALLIWLFVLGLALGLLTGIFGVGGGFVTVPVLNVLFGIDYSLAKGSGLACIFGTSAIGIVKRMKMGVVAKRTMLIIAAGSIFGATFGGYLNDYLETTICNNDQQLTKLLTHPMYFLLLIAAAILVLRGRKEHDSGQTLLQKCPIGPNIKIRVAEMENVSLPGLIALGVFTGVLTGLLGIGGGVLMMPLLLGIVGLSTKQAVGTSMGIVMFSAAAGTAKYAMADSVNVSVAISLIAGGAFGVQLGTKICENLRSARLRKYFVLLILAVIIMVAVDWIKVLRTRQNTLPVETAARTAATTKAGSVLSTPQFFVR